MSSSLWASVSSAENGLTVPTSKGLPRPVSRALHCISGNLSKRGAVLHWGECPQQALRAFLGHSHAASGVH